MDSSEKTYVIDDLNVLDNLILQRYGTKPILPILNFEKNSNLKCKHCKIAVQNNDDLFDHLKICKIFQYTLFGEEVPKHIKKQSTHLKGFPLLKVDKTDFPKNVNVLHGKEIDLDNKTLVDASKEVIYIARAESWINENDFHKIGKCKNFNRLKNRLSTYNTGRLRNLDKFYYESIFVMRN